MAFYSDELIEEVRSANNIVDVISEYVHLQKKGSTYFGLCPFHNEKTGSFSVSPNKQMYYCFGCGAGGNVFTFLKEYENFTFQEAMESLAERAGIVLPKTELSPEQKKQADKRSQMMDLNKEAAKFYYAQLRSPQGEQGLEYFKRRGLSAETMQKFGLGYANKYSDTLYKYFKSKNIPDALLKDSGLVTIDEVRGGHDKFWNRVMFPIMDVHNHVIGFGGRVMGEGEPKYLNSQETMVFDKSRNLYGLNIARTSRRNGLLLCEGYMDVIALHQAGFDNAVASLGTAFTSGHAGLLRRYTKEVYLTFDSDGAGTKAALRALPILKEAGLVAKIINMKPYKDPDEFIKALGAEEYQKRIDEAENSFIFEIRMLQNEFDMKDPQAKTAFHQAVAQKLLGFSEEIERNNYMEAVCEAFFIHKDSLNKLVVNLSNRLDTGTMKKEPLKSGRNAQKGKEDGMKQSQKLLLTWLVEQQGVYPIIKPYIAPSDFTEDIYRQVATVLYAQLDENELNPAKIINLFESEEDQREVAAIFNATLQSLETKAEREKALKDTIIRIKKNSIANGQETMDATDMQALMKIVDDKKMLEKLEKTPINLPE